MTRVISTIVAAAALLAVTACQKPAAASLAAGAEAAGRAPAAEVQPGQEPQPTLPGAPTQEPEAAAKPVPQQLPDVVARVNGAPVTKADFERLIRNMEAGAGQPIPPDRRDEILRDALDQLITYTVLSQEIKSRNVTVNETEVEQNVQQMQAQFPSEDEFKKALAEREMTVEQLKADARNDMAIGKMLEDEVSKQPGPTDVQVRAFYDENLERFKQDEAVRASHILIMVDAKADEATRTAARTRLEAVLEQARGGADFAQLAREHSQDGSAADGGDLNFFTRGRMVPEFEKAAFALKPGEISDVVTTQFGYHIIKVTERRPPSTVPFDQVDGRIREFLAQQQKQERAEAFIKALRSKARIEVLI